MKREVAALRYVRDRNADAKFCVFLCLSLVAAFVCFLVTFYLLLGLGIGAHLVDIFPSKEAAFPQWFYQIALFVASFVSAILGARLAYRFLSGLGRGHSTSS